MRLPTECSKRLRVHVLSSEEVHENYEPLADGPRRHRSRTHVSAAHRGHTADDTLRPLGQSARAAWPGFDG